MIARGLAPQTAHRRPGVAGLLVLVLVVHIAHALRLSAGTLVLGTFVFLVERLAASLAFGRSLGGIVQTGRDRRLLSRPCCHDVITDALLLELLGHATHLPSSAIPR